MKDEGESKLTCPYCGKPARMTTGGYIYPNRKDLDEKVFHVCWGCEAWVGCHPETRTPLGTLANAELRRARAAAHASFDPLWKRGKMSRSGAYAWLRKELALGAGECHIGSFNLEQCLACVEACRSNT